MRWLKPGTDPLELGLALALGMSAVAGLLHGPQAGSAGELLPPVWYGVATGLLLLGCVLTLAGVLSRRVAGLYLEYIGLMAMGTSVSVYGIASLFALHVQHAPRGPAWYSGLLVLGLGVSLLFKWREVDRELRLLVDPG